MNRVEQMRLKYANIRANQGPRIPFMVEIFKNKTRVRFWECDKADAERVIEEAYDIAGGMWNGVDEIIVKTYEKAQGAPGL